MGISTKKYQGGGTYLRADDVDPKRVLTIADVEEKVLTNSRGQSDERLVVSFGEEGVKSLALNATNVKKLDDLSGNTTDAESFIGLRVQLYVEDTPMGKGVRVRGAPTKAKRPGSKADSAPEAIA